MPKLAADFDLDCFTAQRFAEELKLKASKYQSYLIEACASSSPGSFSEPNSPLRNAWVSLMAPHMVKYYEGVIAHCAQSRRGRHQWIVRFKAHDSWCRNTPGCQPRAAPSPAMREQLRRQVMYDYERMCPRVATRVGAPRINAPRMRVGAPRFRRAAMRGFGQEEPPSWVLPAVIGGTLVVAAIVFSSS